MTPAAAESLRRAAAHVVVDDVARPELAEADAHHLFRVLRVRDGEIVTVTDGAGSWRVCRATGGTIAVDGDVATEPPPAAPLTIAFALPKMDRPDWIVQKLTELGVDRIVILHAERSVVRWPGDRVDKHLAKLRRVAREAVQQARRVWVPEIVGPVHRDRARRRLDVRRTAAGPRHGLAGFGGAAGRDRCAGRGGARRRTLFVTNTPDRAEICRPGWSLCHAGCQRGKLTIDHPTAAPEVPHGSFARPGRRRLQRPGG